MEDNKVPFTMTISERALVAYTEISANSRPYVSRNALVGYVLEEWVKDNHPEVYERHVAVADYPHG